MNKAPLFILCAILTILVTFVLINHQLPSLIQMYVNFQSPPNKNVLDINQLDLAQANPLYCNYNTDCIIIPCGKELNCHSITINQHYYNQNRLDLPQEFICPDEEIAPKCDEGRLLDLYVSCEKQQCVLKRFFTPQADISNQE